MTGTAEDQRFSSTGSHNLNPLRFFSTVVGVEIFECTDMMHLDLICTPCRLTDFTYLGQEPFFESRSTVPFRLGPVFGVCLNVPCEGYPSPGRYQWFLSLTWDDHLQHLLHFPCHSHCCLV